MDLNEKMRDLIDKLGGGTEEKIMNNKVLINDISEMCKHTPLYKKNISQTETFSEDKTALELYQLLLIKVANAPTYLHAFGSTVIIMPLIAKKINQKEGL